MFNTKFEEMGAQVLGISTDARPTQNTFVTSLGGIPYPVLADFHPKGKVAGLYDVYDEERGTANRAVIIVDKEGVVQYRRVYATATDLDVADVLAEVEKL